MTKAPWHSPDRAEQGNRHQQERPSQRNSSGGTKRNEFFQCALKRVMKGGTRLPLSEVGGSTDLWALFFFVAKTLLLIYNAGRALPKGKGEGGGRSGGRHKGWS